MNNGLDSLSVSRKLLLSSLKAHRILKSKIVGEALLSIKREDFVWPGTSIAEAYLDEPLPLGDTGQTISAPHMVTIMLEELELKSGLNVLEIGCGSGYNAALLGYIVSKQSTVDTNLVISVERNERLVEFARSNIARVGLAKTVQVVSGDGTLGYPPKSTEPIYDRIIVAAGAPAIPIYLEQQLKMDGIMEIPVGGVAFQTLMKLRKIPKSSAEKSDYVMEKVKVVDCMFVPLVGENGFD